MNDILDVPDIRLTVCICTRNRPDDLVTALESVQASSVEVEQIVVSDDSTDDRTKTLIETRFPAVTFVEGPRHGLCANRNAALCAVRGTHVIFIDDDAALGVDFVREVAALLTALAPVERRRTIVCGLERLRGRLVYPSDQNFLGYQERDYKAGETINTVVINAAVFPTEVFDAVGFDTNLMYGSDEVDLTTRAVARGYAIRICPTAINDHYSSDVNRVAYVAHVNASRLYVTLKRYAFTERAYLKALLFAIVAPLHLILSSLRHRGASGIRTSIISCRNAAGYLLRYARRPSDRSPRQAYLVANRRTPQSA